MLSTSSITGQEAASAKPQADGGQKPYDLTTEIPDAAAPPAPQSEGEFVMGPRQMANLAFVAILLLGIMSAVAYFAGRKNTEAPKVTERVIERVLAAPAPSVPAVAAPKPVPQAKVEVTAPILNRLYLQAGSVDVGVAEVIVEGLRLRGVPAIVGIGVNGKVARILAGPFNSDEEQRAVQKKLEDLNFHPFPRVFSARDLEPQPNAPVNP